MVGYGDMTKCKFIREWSIESITNAASKVGVDNIQQMDNQSRQMRRPPEDERTEEAGRGQHEYERLVRVSLVGHHCRPGKRCWSLMTVGGSHSLLDCSLPRHYSDIRIWKGQFSDEKNKLVSFFLIFGIDAAEKVGEGICQ